jgi:glycolate oxidase iron-sulfur subunit
MQTNFSLAQLTDPKLKEADDILRRCVHCGFCTATCPTYLVLGDERDSPRGRIYLIKEMLETNAPASEAVATHIDRCLGCLSCMTTCPSGVDYMHLVDQARERINETHERPAGNRLARWLLRNTVPYPARFRWALRGARFGRALTAPMERWGLREVAAMLRLAPRGMIPRPAYAMPGTFPAQGGRKKRVILLGGCAQRVLRPDINDATIRLLTRLGVEVLVPEGEGCCGALVQHMGHEADAQIAARANIAAWETAVELGAVDAIVVNASGCGTSVKDYGHLLAGDARFKERATKIAAMALDISEYLSTINLGAPKRWSSLKIAYQSACSLQHGQQVTDLPLQLLRKAGFAVKGIAEPHICCGSAGTYNMLQPELSATLRERKAANIEKAGADVVASGNIGCITQLAPAISRPIVHTVELLDWAYGGPAPRGLEWFQSRMSDVPLKRPPLPVGAGAQT